MPSLCYPNTNINVDWIAVLEIQSVFLSVLIQSLSVLHPLDINLRQRSIVSSDGGLFYFTHRSRHPLHHVLNNSAGHPLYIAPMLFGAMCIFCLLLEVLSSDISMTQYNRIAM